MSSNNHDSKELLNGTISVAFVINQRDCLGFAVCDEGFFVAAEVCGVALVYAVQARKWRTLTDLEGVEWAAPSVEILEAPESQLSVASSLDQNFLMARDILIIQIV